MFPISPVLAIEGQNESRGCDLISFNSGSTQTATLVPKTELLNETSSSIVTNNHSSVPDEEEEEGGSQFMDALGSKNDNVSGDTMADLCNLVSWPESALDFVLETPSLEENNLGRIQHMQGDHGHQSGTMVQQNATKVPPPCSTKPEPQSERTKVGGYLEKYESEGSGDAGEEGSSVVDQQQTSSKSSSPNGEKGGKGAAGRRKLKVDWTPDLHRRFVHAVEQLGVEKAIPSRILELMGVSCLTRHNIASHLQKYRAHRRHLMVREAEAASWHHRRPVDPSMWARMRRDGTAWVASPFPHPHQQQQGMVVHGGPLGSQLFPQQQPHHHPHQQMAMGIPSTFPQHGSTLMPHPHPHPHGSSMMPQLGQPMHTAGGGIGGGATMGMPTHVWGHPAAAAAGAEHPQAHAWRQQQGQGQGMPLSHVLPPPMCPPGGPSMYPPPAMWHAPDGSAWQFPGGAQMLPHPPLPPSADAWGVHHHPAMAMAMGMGGGGMSPHGLMPGSSPPPACFLPQHHPNAMGFTACGASSACPSPMPGLPAPHPPAAAAAAAAAPPHSSAAAATASSSSSGTDPSLLAGGMGAEDTSMDSFLDEAMPPGGPCSFPLSLSPADDFSLDFGCIGDCLVGDDDLNDTKDVLDAAIREALSKPLSGGGGEGATGSGSMLMPLGLKPPSVDDVMAELQKHEDVGGAGHVKDEPQAEVAVDGLLRSCRSEGHEDEEEQLLHLVQDVEKGGCCTSPRSHDLSSSCS